MAAVTYLWARDEYNKHRSSGRERFLCAGGNTFRARGLVNGDSLYIISFFEGHLYLLGRLAVAEVCSPAEAPRLTGRSGFDYSWAADWAVADDSHSSPLFFDLVVPADAVGAIRFEGDRPPVYRKGADATPEPQTFRGVRALSWETAMQFDDLLTSH